MPVQSRGRRLYKYLSPDALGKVLAADDGVSLKCSIPRDFNDPYELFLTLDFGVDPQLLAFYADVVGELPQLPTACFSRRPDVIPMWAHYGRESTGAVLEFDEKALSRRFSSTLFANVAYRDAPDPSVLNILKWASTTLKFRHAEALRLAVFRAAYFTKTLAWRYERERRMVLEFSDVSARDGLQLLLVPRNCVTALVAGPFATSDTKTLLMRRAEDLQCDYYELQIGRSSARPFLLDSGGVARVYDGRSIEQARHFCVKCNEPMIRDEVQCSWCRIGTEEMQAAAEQNPLRVLDAVGMLEQYLDHTSSDL